MNEMDHVLERHLRRTQAPAELWGRVRNPRAPEPEGFAFGRWAAVAAGVLVVVGGWAIWSQMEAPLTVEAMAVAALDRPAEELTLRSADATTVRKWVKAQSGIELPLPPRHAASIRIEGARMGAGLAEVRYQVGEFRAALLVSKDRTTASGYPKHDFRGSDRMDDARVTSWNLKGQGYTLAWTAPGESRTACLLCHDQEPTVLPPSAVN